MYVSVRCLNAGQYVTVMYHFLRLSGTYLRKACKAGLRDHVRCNFIKCGYWALQRFLYFFHVLSLRCTSL